MFLGKHSSEQLLFETSLSDGEVDDGGLGGQLRREGWVGKSTSQEHLEIGVVVELTASNINELVLASSLNLLLKHRVQHRVYFVLDSFDNQGLSFIHTELEEVVLEFGVAELDNGSLRVDGLDELVLDPILALTLRVNE